MSAELKSLYLEIDLETSPKLHLVDSAPVTEAPPEIPPIEPLPRTGTYANISIQPLALQHDGNAGFLRTRNGELLLEKQPFEQPVTIVDFGDIEEELTPHSGRFERVLQTVRSVVATAFPVGHTFR